MTLPRARSLRHVRPVVPLVFPESEPESERMPESSQHDEHRALLKQILRAVCGPEHTVASNAFVYFDASDPQRNLAPDAFVKVGRPNHHFRSWKTWEKGTPELAFEVLSPHDAPGRAPFAEKLERYRAVGVLELVCFDEDAAVGHRLRAWDRIDGDLVERVVEDERTPCLVLGMHLVVAPLPGDLIGIRVARDEEGRDLVRTEHEEAAEARERLRQQEERLRKSEEERAKLEERLREAEKRLADKKP